MNMTRRKVLKAVLSAIIMMLMLWGNVINVDNVALSVIAADAEENSIPSEVVAMPGNSKITVSWNAVDGATGYRVQRLNGAMSWETIADSAELSVTAQWSVSSDGSRVMYTDVGLTNGNSYAYRVSAYVNGVLGSASGLVSASPAAGASNTFDPTAEVDASTIIPQNVSSVAGDSCVKITWSAVPGATRYHIGRKIGDTGSWKICGYTTSTTYIDEKLTNDTVYYYKVKAVVNGVKSNESAETSATPYSSIDEVFVTSFEENEYTEEYYAYVANAIKNHPQYKYFTETHSAPYHSYVERLENDLHFQIALKTWQITTLGFSAEEVANILELPQYKYYLGVLMDVLEQDFKSEDFTTKALSQCQAASVSVFEALSPYVGVGDIIEAAEVVDLPDSTLETISDVFGVSIPVLKNCTDVFDMTNRLGKVAAVKETYESHINAFQSMYYMCDDNPALKQACYDMYMACVNGEESVSYDYIFQSEAMDTVAIMMVETAKTEITKLMGTYGIALQAGQAAGKAVADLSFGTSNQITNYYELKAMRDVEDLVKKMLKTKTGQDFCNAYTLHYKVQMMGYKYTDNYRDILYNQNCFGKLYTFIFSGNYESYCQLLESQKQYVSSTLLHIVEKAKQSYKESKKSVYGKVYIADEEGNKTEETVYDRLIPNPTEPVMTDEESEAAYEKILEYEHTLNGGNRGENFTLTKDLTIYNDYIVSGGCVNLNGYTLTIKGNLVHTGGYVSVNGGTLIVEKDYIGYNESIDGSISAGGYLNMTNSTDYGYVKIEGDCYFNTSNADASYLKFGVLELQGDLVNMSATESVSTAGYAYSYYQFNVKFTGTDTQKVYSTNGQSIYLDGVIFTNNKIEFGDTALVNINLAADGEISGTAYNGNINLNGHSLTVNGNFNHVSGYVNVNGGKLIVKGDYQGYTENADGSISSGGYLLMSNSTKYSYMLVEGDCYMYTSNADSSRLAYGTLELMGDLVNKGNSSISTSSSFSTMFTGEKTQNVYSETGAKIYLNKVRMVNKDVVADENTTIKVVHNLPSEWTTDESGHWKACTYCKDKLDFAEHTENSGEVVTEATEESEGLISYKCIVCDYEIRTENVPKLEHSFDEEWSSDETGHWHTCENCDRQFDFAEHIDDAGTVIEATETEGAKLVFHCTECGFETKTEFIIGFEITAQPVDYIGKIGDTATFAVEATGENLTYQWEQDTGKGWTAINTTAGRKATFSIGVTSARLKYKYRCVVSNGTNTIISDEVKMVVNEEFEITIQPTDFTGKIGDTATFTVEATGENLTYQWEQDTGNGWTAINTTAGRKATFSIGVTAARLNYKYRCVVSNGTTSVTSDEVKMVVEEEFEITTQPTDFTGKIGDTAKFTVEATGENLTYQWEQDTGKGWTAINTTAGRKATFSIGVTAARLNYKYRCVVSNGTNSITSDEVKMVVEEEFEITTQPTDFTGKIGDTATFTVEATGENLTYQWEQDTGNGWTAINTTAGRKATFSIGVTAARLKYKYRCVVSNGTTSITSEEVKMVVNEEFEITTQPTDFTGKIGATATFTVEASGENLTYQWEQDTGKGWTAINTTAGRKATFSIGVTSARLNYKYRCVVSNGTTSVTTNAVKMIVDEDLAITTQPSNYIGAIGSTAKFTVGATGATSYQWYQNTGAGWTAINTTAGRSNTFSVGVAEFRLGYMYRCVVSDGTNTITSDEVQMYIG